MGRKNVFANQGDLLSIAILPKDWMASSWRFAALERVVTRR